MIFLSFFKSFITARSSFSNRTHSVNTEVNLALALRQPHVSEAFQFNSGKLTDDFFVFVKKE